MTLHKFQNDFKDLMLGHPDALNAPPKAIQSALIDDDIPLPARLKVYRNNIIGSLTDIMLASFPLLEKLVGKEFLEGMARSFILQHPPVAGCINTYGAGFDTFIRSFKPAETMPYLADVARMEIALNAAYYAPDDTPLTTMDLGQITPENLPETPLPLRQSVHLIASDFPLQNIRDFCLSTVQNAAMKLDISTGGDYLMIYRPALDSVLVPLTQGEYAALQALQNGHPLGKTLEKTLSITPDFDIAAFLQKHIHLGSFRTR